MFTAKMPEISGFQAAKEEYRIYLLMAESCILMI